MTRDTIERLLDGGLSDPDGGPPLSVPTRNVVIADSLDGGEAESVAGPGLGGRLAVVTDGNTLAVLGARVLRALGGIAQVTDIRLPGRPHADAATIEAIRREGADCDGLIAVGAGTIDDLCKYSAAQDEALNATLAEHWDEIRAQLRSVTLPLAKLEAVPKAAGTPTTPKELGWPRDFYLDAVRHAREIRDRYTFLDLAADIGELDNADVF